MLNTFLFFRYKFSFTYCNALNLIIRGSFLWIKCLSWLLASGCALAFIGFLFLYLLGGFGSIILTGSIACLAVLLFIAKIISLKIRLVVKILIMFILSTLIYSLKVIGKI